MVPPSPGGGPGFIGMSRDSGSWSAQVLAPVTLAGGCMAGCVQIWGIGGIPDGGPGGGGSGTSYAASWHGIAGALAELMYGSLGYAGLVPPSPVFGTVILGGGGGAAGAGMSCQSPRVAAF
mmetsp:Transcript_41166/g.116530  ORF Transcript_41166/g.116530 Transcript_41166/m.116530 type:complete len:121 (+) Transcript_41166:535-897(+)